MLLHLLNMGWMRGATRELRWKNFCVLILPLLSSLADSKTICLSPQHTPPPGTFSCYFDALLTYQWVTKLIDYF